MSRAAVHPALAQLTQLQTLRGRRAFEPSIANSVVSVAGDAQRAHKRLGALAELWQEILPPPIVQATALASMRGGVLQVTADSSAVSFELDRLLRGGAEAQLRQRYRGTLTRIRVRVQPLADDDATPRGASTCRANARAAPARGVAGKAPPTRGKRSAARGRRGTGR
jgi:hypothetical protein